VNQPNIFQQYQQAKGFNAPQAAAAIGVPLSTWRKWLSGAREARSSAKTLVRRALAEHVGQGVGS